MKGIAAENLALFKRLAVILRRISSSLDFTEALGLIVGSGLELVGADACLVLLRKGEEGLRVGSAQGVDPAAAGRFIGLMEESILQDLRVHFGYPASQEISATPLMSDLVLQGILVIIREAPLNDDETWLLTALADQAAITLKNAHLHEGLIARDAGHREDLDRTRNLARELDALLQSVVLDLQGPLRTLTGLAEHGEPTPPETPRTLRARADADARRMDALMHDLLAYLHVTRTEPRIAPVDLEGAVLAALARLETEIKRRDGLLRVGSTNFRVLAEQRTLVRILSYLIANALHRAEPSTKPQVEVRAELRDGFVRISVLNTGPRNGEADAPPSFDVLGKRHRADNPSDTGIGLAIVRRGMERLGGRCGAEAAVESWIELPAS